MVKRTEFVLGLVQFNDLLFAFYPSFVGLCGLLKEGPFKEEETVLRNGDLLKPRIFGLNDVLRGSERFLNRIVSKDLVSSSDLEVTFVHKNLCLKNGLQVRLVNQVEMAFESVKICKRENAPPLATTQVPITVISKK